MGRVFPTLSELISRDTLTNPWIILDKWCKKNVLVPHYSPPATHLPYALVVVGHAEGAPHTNQRRMPLVMP